MDHITQQPISFTRHVQLVELANLKFHLHLAIAAIASLIGFSFARPLLVDKRGPRPHH